MRPDQAQSGRRQLSWPVVLPHKEMLLDSHCHRSRINRSPAVLDAPMWCIDALSVQVPFAHAIPGIWPRLAAMLPDVYPTTAQLRTLQRRLKAWRSARARCSRLPFKPLLNDRPRMFKRILAGPPPTGRTKLLAMRWSNFPVLPSLR